MIHLVCGASEFTKKYFKICIKKGVLLFFFASLLGANSRAAIQLFDSSLITITADREFHRVSVFSGNALMKNFSFMTGHPTIRCYILLEKTVRKAKSLQRGLILNTKKECEDDSLTLEGWDDEANEEEHNLTEITFDPHQLFANADFSTQTLNLYTRYVSHLGSYYFFLQNDLVQCNKKIQEFLEEAKSPKNLGKKVLVRAFLKCKQDALTLYDPKQEGELGSIPLDEVASMRD